jgi:hypothetical protein
VAAPSNGASQLQAELISGWSPSAQTPAEATTAGAAVDFWIDRLLHREMATEDRTQIIDFLTDGGSESTPLAQVRNRLDTTIALILDSPYFQWR